VDKVQNPLVCADARFLYLNRVDPNSGVPQKGMLPGISVDNILTAPLPMVSKQQAKGIQTCLWSEFILDESDLMSMMFPRFLAVAERIWNPDSELAEGLASEKILNDAKKRIAEEYRVLQESGIL
jgi:hexosaminidase